MARIFPPLARATVMAMVAMVAVQAVVAIATLWIGEAVLINRISVGLMLTLAVGALAAAWSLIQTALASNRRPVLFAVGRPLAREAAPRLYAHVDALAKRLGANPPDHIVLGIDTNFYVTSADVRTPERAEPLRGQTLYVSSGLARLFAPDELDAVLGHELGHFRGEDTAYSLRFAPVYASLGGAIHGMVNRDGRVAWLALPAIRVLGLLYDLFAEAEAAIGRDRELEADRAGAEAARTEAMGRALMKVALHAEALSAALGAPHSLDHAAADGSLPLAFARRLAAGFDREAWSAALETGLGEAVAHPIDTHPPMRTRLAAIGFDPAAVDLAGLAPPQGPCGADLIDDLADAERALSQMYVEAAEPAFVAPSVLTRVADAVGDPTPR
jgi:Zn-dependent protease with chaperone function